MKTVTKPTYQNLSYRLQKVVPELQTMTTPTNQFPMNTVQYSLLKEVNEINNALMKLAEDEITHLGLNDSIKFPSAMMIPRLGNWPGFQQERDRLLKSVEDFRSLYLMASHSRKSIEEKWSQGPIKLIVTLSSAC